MTMYRLRRGDRDVLIDRQRQRVFHLRRRVRAWSRTLDTILHDHKHRLVMITLTYRDVDAWRPLHISQYIASLRGCLFKRLVAYAWVAELQERGAVHYHLLVVVKRGSKIPMPDVSGMWPHGWSNMKTARSPYYVLKYTSKGCMPYEADYPKGLRMFGLHIRSDAVGAAAMWLYRLSVCPLWLTELIMLVPGLFLEVPKRDSVVGSDGERFGFWQVGGRSFKSPYRYRGKV
jgi:hypothetical protein